MVKHCDNCGMKIGVDIDSRLKAVEDANHMYYELRDEIGKIIKNDKASKIKSKFKRFLFRKFGIINVKMPIPHPDPYGSLDFCDVNCQDDWKNEIKKCVLSEVGE